MPKSKMVEVERVVRALQKATRIRHKSEFNPFVSWTCIELSEAIVRVRSLATEKKGGKRNGK